MRVAVINGVTEMFRKYADYFYQSFEGERRNCPNRFPAPMNVHAQDVCAP